MSFSRRIAAAVKHEKAVLDWLRLRGLHAFAFGQGLLEKDCQDNLKRFDTHVRWMPDIIVFSKRQRRYGYIDAKTGRLDTANHSIEIAAIKAAEAWQSFSSTNDYFFVWENGETATFQTVLEHLELIPGCTDGIYNGSGTPFVLFPRVYCVSFNKIFGPAA